MPLGKRQQQLGDLTKEDINFPKHLTPEIVHTALFVHNAPSKEDIIARVEYGVKEIGEQAMSYVMALLVLPALMDNTRDSTEYKTWQEMKKKKMN